MTAPAFTAHPRILVVDDEPSLREVLAIALKRVGATVVTAPGVRAALKTIRDAAEPYPLVITDLIMPDGSGMDVLVGARLRAQTTEVIVMTAHSTVEAAVDAMRQGAADFIIKPFSPGHLVAQAQKALEKRDIRTENRRLKAQLSRLEQHDVDLGTSPKMREVQDTLDKIAATKTTVLITGESGTGKERVARLIHTKSDRKDRPFRVINCGALPEALMESELFGHVKGAFTGAVTASNGLFREADGGTVLLDEVGELPLSLQVKLLRVLQERLVRPVGGSEEVPVDVRLLAATNRDVEADVKAGLFRQDLYYRLNVIRIGLPRLSERPEDIPRLAEKFLRGFAEELGKDVRAFTPDALRALARYDFPGNVRELENIVERAVALASASSIGLGDLTAEISGASSKPTPLLGAELPVAGLDLEAVLGEVERRLLLQALERSHGVRTDAAKLLSISFRSLRYRLTKHGIDVGDCGDDEQE